MTDRQQHDVANAEQVRLLREALDAAPDAETEGPAAPSFSQREAACGARLTPAASLV